MVVRFLIGRFIIESSGIMMMIHDSWFCILVHGSLFLLVFELLFDWSFMDYESMNFWIYDSVCKFEYR